MLEERAGIPVTGVVPYFHLDIDEEDSLTERFQKKDGAGLLEIAVIRLPRISNFTDIAPLEAMEEVNVRYVSSPAEFGSPDAVILPGSKNYHTGSALDASERAGGEDIKARFFGRPCIRHLRRLSDAGRGSIRSLRGRAEGGCPGNGGFCRCGPFSVKRDANAGRRAVS